MPGVGTEPEPTSLTEGFGSRIHSSPSASLPVSLSACSDTTTQQPCLARAPQGSKLLWTFIHGEKQGQKWESLHPHLGRVHWLSQPLSMEKNALGRGREQNIPDISAQLGPSAPHFGSHSKDALARSRTDTSPSWPLHPGRIYQCLSLSDLIAH